MSAFTRRTLWTARAFTRVNAISAVLELQIVKLLIQSTLTLANRTKGSVCQAASHLGVTCPP